MKNSHYGIYGGQYIAESLMMPILELEEAYDKYKKDPLFLEELDYYMKHYVGRETPLTFAKRLTEYIGGAKIYLKREDLNHTGAHKINNVLGQVLLAKRMNKKKLIAETGAGMHGVAVATVAALFNIECEIFMGEIDIKRQKANVDRMKILGAKLHSVSEGTKTLKDAMNEAMRFWTNDPKNIFYVIGTAAGPHPYPIMVQDFQSIIGKEAKKQILEIEKKLPNLCTACVGGGSNAIGLFTEFLDDLDVKLIGVEAGGKGINTGEHAASINGGKLGVLHGAKTKLLETSDGQILDTYSISAGLDYPGVGPVHCYLNDIKRVNYEVCDDIGAIKAFDMLSKLEGIIPALESSHAAFVATQKAKIMKKDEIIIVCLSGRGDKDIETILKYKSENNE